MPSSPQRPTALARLFDTPLARRTALRRTALGGAAAAVGVTSACKSDSHVSGTPVDSADPLSTEAASTPTPTPTPTLKPELPGGGRTVFPTYRLFGYCGEPGAPGQGQLGIGDLDDAVGHMLTRSTNYAKGRKILPIMELIVTTVLGSPGKDGLYRAHIDEATIQKWLDEARKRSAYLLLNIQPGRADFLDEVKYFEKWLVNPDVGVALDPEWSMGPGEIPMHVFGHTTGAKLDECAAWLADLVAQHDLPEKVMVYHQLSPVVVRQESGLKQHTGVALVKSVDGIGSPGAKLGTYHEILKTTPKYVHPGFKLFFQEDVQQGGHLMTSSEVMAIRPTPEYVLFE